MKVMVVGGGGREHALVWACARSDSIEQLFCAPGNAGTAELATNLNIAATDAAQIAHTASSENIDLVIVGPDAALAAGVADRCREQGIAVFGPSAAAARIESSKGFAKRAMDELSIPTAAWAGGGIEQRTSLVDFAEQYHGNCVVKADGLALGKGVTVCDDMEQVRAALDECFTQHRFGEAGAVAIVEERLRGREVSAFAICDGTSGRMLPLATDYKRAYDLDLGPNTGGMGAYSPPRGIDTEALTTEVHTTVVGPTLRWLGELGTPFIGCLYVGLMVTDDGTRVLEYNARFGDPETQVLMPLMAPEFVDTLHQAANGKLTGVVPYANRAAVTVVLAHSGYPDAVQTGGTAAIPESLPADVVVFHAGTAQRDGLLEIAGGRVFNVTGLGESIEQARTAAYSAVEMFDSDQLRWRADIAAVG